MLYNLGAWRTEGTDFYGWLWLLSSSCHVDITYVRFFHRCTSSVPLAHSSVHSLKCLSTQKNDFHAIYELIKPLVKKHLKVVVQEKDDAVKKSPCEPSINEKVQKVLREKKYSGEIFNSVASIVSKNHKMNHTKLQLLH